MSRAHANEGHSSRAIDRLARALVQAGFLGLFLYPLGLALLSRLTFLPAPASTSWLLPWDALLLGGGILARNWPWLIVGAPLFLLAFSLIMGRSFCGWVCPLGTIFDLLSALAFWRGKHRRPSRWKLFRQNLTWRYYLLAAVTIGAAFSLKWLGAIDPLVIFQRISTTIAGEWLALGEPALRVWLPGFSLIFLALWALEWWQPRFWCRNLCPLGALLSLVSRRSLFNRRVSTTCNACGDCRRACPMRAIPDDPHDTRYSDCTFCLECRDICPRGSVTFGFGPLASRRWVREGVERGADGSARLSGHYAKAEIYAHKRITRRQVLTGVVAGAAGLAATPLVELTGAKQVLRPPGALPEANFVRTCILCQECIRVCPTGALQPAFLEAGLAGIGTPMFVPRNGGCALNLSCPDLCAQVCPVGALRPIRPEELKIGLARVQRDQCLAWNQGVKCLVCVEACLNSAAIAYQGRVTVDPQRCTGCGRCESGCPVAGSAIHVEPRQSV